MTNDLNDNQAQLVKRIDELCSHMWMVRTFLKHSEEHEEDLGGPLKDGDHAKYLKQAKKKLRKLKNANELFQEIQPEISSHTNFQMAAVSLQLTVAQITDLLEG